MDPASLNSYQSGNMTKRWIPLDAENLDSKTREDRQGIHVELSFSPYDIPEAVRGYYSPELKRFIVELKYMSDEPMRTRRISEHVEAVEGSRSGRLHALQIDVDSTSVQEVSISLNQAVAEVLSNTEWQKNLDGGRRKVNDRLFEALKKDIIPKVIA